MVRHAGTLLRCVKGVGAKAVDGGLGPERRLLRILFNLSQIFKEDLKTLLRTTLLTRPV